MLAELGDVVLNERRSRSSQGYYGSRSQYRQIPAKHAVVRPEGAAYGSQGGKTAAKNMTAAERSARAKKAATAAAKKRTAARLARERAKKSPKH
jgi:hypothetical protein